MQQRCNFLKRVIKAESQHEEKNRASDEQEEDGVIHGSKLPY